MINKIKYTAVFCLIALMSIGQIAAKEKSYELSNGHISRIVKVKDGVIRTTHLVNTSTKEVIPLKSIAEFQLRVSDGTGKTNTDRTLDSDDFKIEKVLVNSRNELSFLLSNKQENIQAELTYELKKDEFFTRKYLKIKAQKRLVLERVDLEVMDGGLIQPYQKKLITAQGPAQWKPGLGQPLFGDEKPFFMGVEFPASDNFVGPDQRAFCGYLWGRELKAGESYVSYPSVIGIGDERKTLDRTFQSYIDKIRIRPHRLQVQYNSWFDFGQGVSKEKFESSVRKVHEELVVKRGVPPLNAYVIDDGWQDVKADWSDQVWKVNDKFDPDFSSSFDLMGAADSKLGLWLSPGCLFGAQAAAKNMGKQGFELLGNWMSMAGPKYMGLLENRMLELTENGVSYFKLDGIFGHLNIREYELKGSGYGVAEMPQLGTEKLSPSDSLLNDSKFDELKTYYLAAGTERLMEIFKKQHEINPEVYIVISNGAYLSPWWLMHIDAVWMINAGDAARGSSRTEELVYRDGVYYDIWKEENTQYPMNSIFNHEPKKTKTGESKEEFLSYLMMNLSRGTGFVELYLKTQQLSDADWEVLAEGLKWAHRAIPYFNYVTMHGGDPEKQQVYGYSGWSEKGGYLSLHNPDTSASVNYKVSLDEHIGLEKSDQRFDMRAVVGQLPEEKQKFHYGDQLELEVGPGEILLIEFDSVK
ncbi:hypothetical protein GCM10028791_08690 [Echinicola sediminis]